MTIEAVEAVARKAILHGMYPAYWRDNLQARRYLEWDVSGGCEKSVPIELYGRHSVRHGIKRPPMTVVLHTRCRCCMWCKNQRRAFWSLRAQNEYNASSRTWFATLTLSPHEQWVAEETARRENWNFDGLREEQKFARIVSVIGRELTRFIKRVRKNSKARIRYLLVAEKHKSGLPHFHMLIHEISPEAPVRKAVLKEAWRSGFSKFALCDDAKGARYLCKYLSKEASTRVRASFRYGISRESGATHELHSTF